MDSPTVYRTTQQCWGKFEIKESSSVYLCCRSLVGAAFVFRSNCIRRRFTAGQYPSAWCTAKFARLFTILQMNKQSKCASLFNSTTLFRMFGLGCVITKRSRDCKSCQDVSRFWYKTRVESDLMKLKFHFYSCVDLESLSKVL